MNALNPVGLLGIEFIEFSSPQPAALDKLFTGLGFRHEGHVPFAAVSLYRQNDIRWLLNTEAGSFAKRFGEAHGPSIPSVGWRVRDAKEALRIAVERGAREYDTGDYHNADGEPIPAVYGIGDSLIYFIDNFEDGRCYRDMGFAARAADTSSIPSPGFLTVDHLTNNVPNGSMNEWTKFYKEVFGFTEVRHFDIKGKKTGLTSYALRSPDGSFCIPVNEAKDEKSQINEYLREYGGAGVQHVALLTDDIVKSLHAIRTSAISLLSVDPDYYRTVFDRVPGVVEDKRELENLGILVDGDEEGYLLQIFTQNVIGPIFFEIIQRKNHLSFGEGNFGALFRSIENDQEKRGVL